MPSAATMRVLLVLAIVVTVAVAAFDALAPADWVGPGSVSIEPWTGGLAALPDVPECVEAVDEFSEPCPLRFAFGPATTVTAWISVRNDGSMPVTLNGIAQDWIDQYADVVTLGKPVAGLDGGSFDSGLSELTAVHFEPVIMDPGDERILGVEFATTGDLAFACDQWEDGGAVQWEDASIAWQWLVFVHEGAVAFNEPFAFMAPTAEDCS